MSGVLHSVGKVFSKVWDFIRPIVEVIAIAVAIYFTAGLALSAFPATAGFAAALPGFASASGVAGAGIFSSVATSIGLGGGLAAGAAADTAATAAAAAAAGGAGAAAAGGAAAGAGTVASIAAPTAEAAAAGVAPVAGADLAAAGATAAALPAVAAPVAGATAGLSLTDKLLLASVGTNLVGGLTAPTPKDIAAARAKFYGSFYGTDETGKQTGAPNLAFPNAAGAGTGSQMPGVTIPGQVTSALPAVPTGAPAPATAQAGNAQAGQQRLIPNIPYTGQPNPGAPRDFAVTGTTAPIGPRLIPMAGAP